MKSKIKSRMLFMTLLPLVLLGAISIFLTLAQFSNYIKSESAVELYNTASTISTTLDQLYPGNYHVESVEGKAVFEKGDYKLNGRVEYLDILKASTGLEYSIFYENTRTSTTIKNQDGYIIGTSMNDEVWNDLKATSSISREVVINREKYYSYYIPLKDANDTIIGSIGVAKKMSDITKRQINVILPIMGAIILLIVLTAAMIIAYAKELTDCIGSIKDFVDSIANERYGKRLSEKIYQRDDELGAIGRSVTIMRNSLRDMLEQDTLTQLYNRRTGNKKLEAIREKCKCHKKPFSLAVGDIDFFKKVNDTYGHEAGDEVLKEVSELIRKHMKNNGFVARWGGEEFMLGFENKTIDKAEKIVLDILNEIRKATIEYDGQIIDITMTFGMVEGELNKTSEELFEMADKRLYYGKQHGRNQLVKEDIE